MNLSTSVELQIRQLESSILSLEREWDRLDSTGRYREQIEIEKQLKSLNEKLSELKGLSNA